MHKHRRSKWSWSQHCETIYLRTKDHFPFFWFEVLHLVGSLCTQLLYLISQSISFMWYPTWIIFILKNHYVARKPPYPIKSADSHSFPHFLRFIYWLLPFICCFSYSLVSAFSAIVCNYLAICTATSWPGVSLDMELYLSTEMTLESQNFGTILDQATKAQVRYIYNI